MPFISLHDPMWSELLRQTEYDFYCLPGYAQLDAKWIGGKAIAWHKVIGDNVFLIPLIERAVNNFSYLKDLVSPYGYPGVLCKYPDGDKETSTALESFNDEAAEAGYVSSFLRLNPFRNNWNLELKGEIKQICIGTTVGIDLSADYLDIVKSLSKNHYRNIKKSSSSGFVGLINKWEFFPDFINVYHETMKRLNADSYYFFPVDYFESLREILRNKLILVSIHDDTGRLCSGGLFIIDGKIMHYHLGCTSNDSIRLSPSKLMLFKAIEYGKDNGAGILHLGGGLGASDCDGLFRFKRGFGRVLKKYSTVRMIHDARSYDDLAQQDNRCREYFPAYRQPSI